MLFDFHTHTSFSDGTTSPIKLIRRVLVNNFSSIILTDHTAVGWLEHIISEVAEVRALSRSQWDILVIPGIELTHVLV
jgi:histidinol phosphatase-like PHP family hydrolase